VSVCYLNGVLVRNPTVVDPELAEGGKTSNDRSIRHADSVKSNVRREHRNRHRCAVPTSAATTAEDVTPPLVIFSRRTLFHRPVEPRLTLTGQHEFAATNVHQYLILFDRRLDELVYPASKVHDMQDRMKGHKFLYHVSGFHYSVVGQVLDFKSMLNLLPRHAPHGSKKSFPMSQGSFEFLMLPLCSSLLYAFSEYPELGTHLTEHQFFVETDDAQGITTSKRGSSSSITFTFQFFNG
jgi:hypothetical protein